MIFSHALKAPCHIIERQPVVDFTWQTFKRDNGCLGNALSMPTF